MLATKRIVRSLIVALTATIAAACTQHSAGNESPANVSTQNRAQQTQAAQNAAKSVRTYVDPATGQLREPTQDELAAEAAADAAKKRTESNSQAKPSEPREIRLPNGAIAIQLDESAQQPLRACVAQDGDVKVDHDCDSKAAAALSDRK